MMQRRGVAALILMMRLLGQADALPRVSEPRVRSTRYIRPGRDVDLKCSAEGSQIFRFTWMKYGQRLPVSTGQYGSLTIVNFTLRDQGHYTCRVDDYEGYDVSPDVSLILAQLDKQWNVAVRPVMANEMSSMSFTCDHPPFCVPPGRYSWFRIEGETPSQVMTTNRIMVDKNGTLHFAFVVEKDGGIYRCGIHNTVLDNTRLGSQVNVTVQAHPNVRHVINLTGIPPHPMSYSAETTLVLGTEARLECIFSGMPAPTVTWFRNGPKTKVDLTGGSTLTIQKVHEGDGGNYTCSGMNSNGKVSKTIQLSVVSGPIWERKPVAQYVSKGQDVTFVCTARAIGPTSPLVTQWIHDLGPDRRVITLSQDKSALTFHSVSGGTDCITCNISNNIDFISQTACYKVIKSSPTLLIIVTSCTVIVVVLIIMLVIIFVIYKKVNDLGKSMRSRLSSISHRRRRNTIVNATAGTSTGYLELEALSSRFSAATENRLLSEALKQYPMGVSFHPVRKSISHNFLRGITRTDMNDFDLWPITRPNSDSCMSTRPSYINPNYSVRTSNHMLGSYTVTDRMANHFGDSRGDVGCRNFSGRHQEAQNRESRKTRMDTAGWVHNCGIHEGDKPRAASQRKMTRFNQVPQNIGQQEWTRGDGCPPVPGRCQQRCAVKHQETCFDKGSDVQNGGDASRIVHDPHLGRDAHIIEKEMFRLGSEFEMCPDENIP